MLLLSFNLRAASYQVRLQSAPKSIILKKPKPKQVVLEDSSSNVKVRSFDLTRIKEYKADKDFKYDNVAPENESLWTRFWKWFWRLFENVFSSSTAGNYFGYFIIAAFVALLIYLLMRLSGVDFKFLSSKSKTLDVPYAEAMDNIHEINFDQEIEKASGAGNYRLAIRMFYLRTLKYLSDTDQIDWQPEKTNQAYILEIADSNKKDLFKQLTNQFEYIWYGEFFLDQNRFNELKLDFNNFNRKL
ncbi:hypothetical protein ACXZ1K_01980 [Pedobacter sp. PWIIR3]